jgi:hypothetical protein
MLVLKGFSLAVFEKKTAGLAEKTAAPAARCTTTGPAAQQLSLLLNSWACCSTAGPAAQQLGLLLNSWACC